MKNLFNAKIDFQEYSSTGKDAWGSESKTWADVSGLTDVPCRINWVTLSGRGEHIINNQIQWTRDAKVYCAYYDSVTSKMRMVYNSKNYDIVNFANVDEKGQYMRIDVKRVKD